MSHEKNKLFIWEHGEKIDPAYCKKDDNGGYQSLSINAYWVIRKATELMGPMGVAWGFEILEERLDKGHTIWHEPSLKTDSPISLGHVSTHTIKLKLWYECGDKKGEVVNFGHTKHMYKTKYGITTDDEAPKKSLTDAMKKCLSMIGFAGEVYMGEYDNSTYMNEVRQEFALEKAEDKGKEIEDRRKELISNIENNVESIRNAVIPNEANHLGKSILRILNSKMKSPHLADIAKRGMKAISAELEQSKKKFEKGHK